MGTLLIKNIKSFPRHFEIRSGKSPEAELNPLVYEGVLYEGESREIDFEVFIFERSKYCSIETSEKFTNWIRYGSDKVIDPLLDNSLSDNDINKLVEMFRTQTLPSDMWTHQAHVITAVWYYVKFGDKVALSTLREDIQKYNSTIDLSLLRSKGYHETLTRFWLIVVKRFMQALDLNTLQVGVQKILNSDVAKKEFPLNFYTREKLFSNEARLQWVEPDLNSLEYLEHFLSKEVTKFPPDNS